MIPQRDSKIKAVTRTIQTRMAEFNQRYRSGPSLYFYRRILSLRRSCPKIDRFLSSDYHLEILYAVLIAWDMDSRRARLKDFDDFKCSLLDCLDLLRTVEGTLDEFVPSRADALLASLSSVFRKLSLMQTSARLVSNSKCLHFLFPTVCMPMDGLNTLQYLYGNTGESVRRYEEITSFCCAIMAERVEFTRYLDDQWNQSVPKLVDNAIILLNDKSVKHGTRSV